MAKQETQIQKYEPKSFAIATMEVAELKQTVEDNLGGDRLSEWDMERYIMPSGKGLTFTVETASNASSANELVGVIVFQQNRRTWWAKSKDESDGDNGPPDCESSDGVHGVGIMADKCGGLCASCPKSKFGSAVDKNGNATKGQACSQKKCLFILKPDSILPCVLMVPPTSLTNLKQYLAALISARKPYFGVVTKITLKSERSKSGKDYGELRFEMLEKIEDPAIVERFKKAGEFFSKSLGTQTNVTKDGSPVQETKIVEVEAKVVHAGPVSEDHNDQVVSAGPTTRSDMKKTNGINPGQ